MLKKMIEKMIDYKLLTEHDIRVWADDREYHFWTTKEIYGDYIDFQVKGECLDEKTLTWKKFESRGNISESGIMIYHVRKAD